MIHLYKVKRFKYGELNSFASSIDFGTPCWVRFYRHVGKQKEADELVAQQWQRKAPGNLVDEDGSEVPEASLDPAKKEKLLRLRDKYLGVESPTESKEIVEDATEHAAPAEMISEEKGKQAESHPKEFVQEEPGKSLKEGVAVDEESSETQFDKKVTSVVNEPSTMEGKEKEAEASKLDSATKSISASLAHALHHDLESQAAKETDLAPTESNVPGVSKQASIVSASEDAIIGEDYQEALDKLVPSDAIRSAQFEDSVVSSPPTAPEIGPSSEHETLPHAATSKKDIHPPIASKIPPSIRIIVEDAFAHPLLYSQRSDVPKSIDSNLGDRNLSASRGAKDTSARSSTRGSRITSDEVRSMIIAAPITVPNAFFSHEPFFPIPEDTHDASTLISAANRYATPPPPPRIESFCNTATLCAEYGDQLLSTFLSRFELAPGSTETSSNETATRISEIVSQMSQEITEYTDLLQNTNDIYNQIVTLSAPSNVDGDNKEQTVLQTFGSAVSSATASVIQLFSKDEKEAKQKLYNSLLELESRRDTIRLRMQRCVDAIESKFAKEDRIRAEGAALALFARSATPGANLSSSLAFTRSVKYANPFVCSPMVESVIAANQLLSKVLPLSGSSVGVPIAKTTSNVSSPTPLNPYGAISTELPTSDAGHSISASASAQSFRSLLNALPLSTEAVSHRCHVLSANYNKQMKRMERQAVQIVAKGLFSPPSGDSDDRASISTVSRHPSSVPPLSNTINHPFSPVAQYGSDSPLSLLPYTRNQSYNYPLLQAFLGTSRLTVPLSVGEALEDFSEQLQLVHSLTVSPVISRMVGQITGPSIATISSAQNNYNLSDANSSSSRLNGIGDPSNGKGGLMSGNASLSTEALSPLGLESSPARDYCSGLFNAMVGAPQPSKQEPSSSNIPIPLSSMLPSDVRSQYPYNLRILSTKLKQILSHSFPSPSSDSEIDTFTSHDFSSSLDNLMRKLHDQGTPSSEVQSAVADMLSARAVLSLDDALDSSSIPPSASSIGSGQVCNRRTDSDAKISKSPIQDFEITSALERIGEDFQRSFGSSVHPCLPLADLSSLRRMSATLARDGDKLVSNNSNAFNPSSVLARSLHPALFFTPLFAPTSLLVDTILPKAANKETSGAKAAVPPNMSSPSESVGSDKNIAAAPLTNSESDTDSKPAGASSSSFFSWFSSDKASVPSAAVSKDLEPSSTVAPPPAVPSEPEFALGPTSLSSFASSVLSRWNQVGQAMSQRTTNSRTLPAKKPFSFTGVAADGNMLMSPNTGISQGVESRSDWFGKAISGVHADTFLWILGGTSRPYSMPPLKFGIAAAELDTSSPGSMTPFPLAIWNQPYLHKNLPTFSKTGSSRTPMPYTGFGSELFLRTSTDRLLGACSEVLRHHSPSANGPYISPYNGSPYDPREQTASLFLHANNGSKCLEVAPPPPTDDKESEALSRFLVPYDPSEEATSTSVNVVHSVAQVAESLVSAAAKTFTDPRLLRTYAESSPLDVFTADSGSDSRKESKEHSSSNSTS